MQIEPSTLRDRVCLLWTFRNFRRLSPLLLSAREKALVNTLYRNSAGVISNSHDPVLVIGVVEDFVPMDDAAEVALAVVSPALVPQKRRQEKIVATPAPVIVTAKAGADSGSRPAKAARRDAEKSAKREIAADGTAWPRFSWRKFSAAKASDPKGKAGKAAAAKAAAYRAAASGSKTSATRPSMLRRMTAKFATAAGALFLCVLSVAAWHRMEAVPDSQAENRPEYKQTRSAEAPQSVSPVVLASESASAPAAATKLVADPEFSRPEFIRPESTKSDFLKTDAAKLETAKPTPSMPADIVAKPAPSVAVSEAVKPTTIAAAVPPTMPKPAQKLRTRDAASSLPLAGQASEIEATRGPLRYVYPDYSDIKARGVVRLTAGVDSEGRVRAVKVVSGNRALAAAAVRAVRQWRYRPYLKDGQPVATETNIVISFISSDAISMTFPTSNAATR
jgi:TonB family protein